MLTELISIDISLYIACTCDPAHLESILDSGKVQRLFTSICCDESTKVNMVRGIIGECNSKEWIMVGDHHKDIEANAANGIPILDAGLGYLRLTDRSRFNGAIGCPDELIEWIEWFNSR